MADNWLPQQVGDLCAKSPGLFFSNRRVEENSLGLLGWCCLLPMSNCDWTIKLARVDTYTTVPGSVASTLNHQTLARVCIIWLGVPKPNNTMSSNSRARMYYIRIFFLKKKLQPFTNQYFSADFQHFLVWRFGVKNLSKVSLHSSAIILWFYIYLESCHPFVAPWFV